MSSPFSLLTEMDGGTKESALTAEPFGVVNDGSEKPEHESTDGAATTATEEPSSQASSSVSLSNGSSVPRDVVDETLASITALTTKSSAPSTLSSSTVHDDPFGADSSAAHASPLATQVPPKSKASRSPVESTHEQIPQARPPRVLVLYHSDEQGFGTSYTTIWSSDLGILLLSRAKTTTGIRSCYISNITQLD